MQLYQMNDPELPEFAMAHFQPDDSVIEKKTGAAWTVETRIGGVYQLRNRVGELKLVQRGAIKRATPTNGQQVQR